jgi:phi13 family phage major tail protein
MPKPTIIIGIEKAYIAIQTKDDSTGVTYNTPKYYSGVKEIGMKPKQNVEPLWGENQIMDQAVAFQQADIDISLASLTSAQRVEILGQNIAAAGGVYAKSNDVPPFVALLYKATIAGGYRYGVFYKGLFTIPDESMKGQEGKVTYSIPKMSAAFIPTVNNSIWEYHVDTTDPNCPVNIDTTWFNSVATPNADIITPKITCVPANNATAVAVSSDVVMSFLKAIDSSSITSGNVILMKADGTLVNVDISINTLNTIVTIHPLVNLTAATVFYAICTTDVKSATGVPLAAINVFKFTTA